MSLYSDPPPLHTFSEDKPTLLVCWWVTIVCTAIILSRVMGRMIRSEELFSEDRAAAITLIPLYLRMGCVHVILLYGTNNAQLADAGLTEDELHRKAVASGLVLLSRVLYAAILWTLKNTVLEFLKRLNANWERAYELMLLFIRCSLVATFVAVVISDLTECHPFTHYWQVLPDPGGQCRQGYATLLTTAACNILTDLMLVIFPIIVVTRSALGWRRKAQLVVLFSLSLAVVGTTVYRVPKIIEARGGQQARSLYASVEILFATAAANALVLASFVRDRGVKKKKWEYVAAAAEELSARYGSRRPTLNQHWGSDEDLARDTGFGVARDLRHEPESSVTADMFRAPAGTRRSGNGDLGGGGGGLWQTNGNNSNNPASKSERPSDARSDDPLLFAAANEPSSSSGSAPRQVSFLELVGAGGDHHQQRRGSGKTSRQNRSGTASSSQHTAVPSPLPSVRAGTGGLRRGSAAFLQDLGGLLTPLGGSGSSSSPPPLPMAVGSSSSRRRSSSDGSDRLGLVQKP